MKNIILFGPQGSGKGTQAKLISKKFNLPHISTGDIFRQNIKDETELGKEVKEIINSGALVPDNLTNQIVKDRLMKKDCQNGFILDGFPRNIKQAKFLDLFTNIDLALEIWINDKEAIKRIGERRTCSKCGAVYHITHLPPNVEGICDKCEGELIIRDDDKEDAIKIRLKSYHEQTSALTEYYSKKHVYKKVDGSQSIKKVNDDVSKILK